MTGDWRDYRRAIWTAMAGVAFAILVNPWASALFFGAAIGLAAAVPRRRRARPAAGPREDRAVPARRDRR